MSAKKLISFLLAAILLMAAGSSCDIKKLKQIKATGWTLESVSLHGLRSLKADLLLELENPAMKVTLTDIQGVIYYDGEPFVHYGIDPLTLDAKTTRPYSCSCVLVLDTSKSILDVLAILPKMSSDHITTDISAKAKVKGFSKKFSFQNVPIKRFLKKN